MLISKIKWSKEMLRINIFISFWYPFHFSADIEMKIRDTVQFVKVNSILINKSMILSLLILL